MTQAVQRCHWHSGLGHVLQKRQQILEEKKGQFGSVINVRNEKCNVLWSYAVYIYTTFDN